MFGYKVDISQHCHESHQSDEQYGDWYSSSTNTFESVSKCTDSYPDAASVEDIPTGSLAYVVWAEYSSGDSFGRGDCCSTEVLAVFTNNADAVGLAKHIREQNGKDVNTYKFTASTGQVFESGFAPWSGYFEHLDTVYVEHATVGGGCTNRF